MRQELLSLMINFKLCYRFVAVAVSYLAPQLLSDNQPEYDWDADNNLIFKYSYDFMPKGIVTQLTVAMHPLIGPNGSVWKSGVVLQRDNQRRRLSNMPDDEKLRFGSLEGTREI